MHDVIVVGGGTIGLSIAHEIAIRGGSALVLERGETGEGASWAAAGMLAPQSEAAQDDAFFRLCLASHQMYPAWVGRIHEESGVDPAHTDSGLLFLAGTEDALAELHRRFDWQRASGMHLDVLSADQTYALEPAITLPLAGALLMPDEHHITPRKLTRALKAACAARNVDIRTGQRVEEVVSDVQAVTGVKVGSETLRAAQVVVASGAWTSQIRGLYPRIPVTPRKGQILSLTMPSRTFKHMIRWNHNYAVPRPSGELVVGATNEDVGFDRSLTPQGVGQLLAAVQQLSTAASCYPIQEMWTGLRPATPDGLPVLGAGRHAGLIYATGHYRNGVLLAPITASIIADFIEGRSPQLAVEAFSPRRFEV